MNGNAELLNFIYQNSEMGVDTLNQLLEVVKGSELRKQIEAQLKEYTTIHQQAKDKLNQNGYDEKGIGSFDKLKTYMMLNFQTMMDKSDSHIAEMMMVGSNMGVIDAVKNINKYTSAEKDIINMMEHLMQFEENNIQRLKKFL